MRLIRGAPGTGKTGLVFREFKEALRQGRRDMRIVVPTATLVRHFQHELARDGAVFPPGAILSLSRFAFERAPECRLVPDGLLRAIVRDALRRLKPAEFAEVSGTEGMTATILDTIVLFENAGANIDKLASVRGLKPHAKAFGKIWRAVDQAVRAAGYQTRAQILRAAALNETPGTVWMDGFINLSAAERELVASVAKVCELTMTLTDSPGADDVRRFALGVGARETLLSGKARKPQTTVVSAASLEREADEIARRVLALNEKGVRFREMGVALREAGTYLPLLQGTFERFGIPARYYFATPLRQHAAATFLSGLIDCVLQGWEFSGALAAIQAHPAWGVSSAFDRFDFKVREAMPGAGGAELVALAEEEFGKKIAQCVALDSWRTILAKPRDWALKFRQMAEKLYRPGLLDAPKDRRSVEMARSHAAAMGAWVDAVASAAGFWREAEEPVSLESFWLVAQEAIEGASVQVADDRREVVHVMSVYEARQWDVSTLFVCGMTNRDFPKKNPQNLLFPDPDLDAIQKSIPGVRKASEQDAEENALWEALRTRAQDELILTFPEHDAGGKSTQSSAWLSGFAAEKAQVCQANPAVSMESAGVAGRIEQPPLLGSLTELHRKISLSSVEDLLQCRFKFFAGRTLSLKPRPERPEERMQAKVGGLIMHEALEAWLNKNKQGDFVELFETAFDDMCHKKHLPPGWKLEVEHINLRNIARKVSATEQWTPLSSEAEVELNIDFPGGVTVTCRVDRIDHITESDCVIVDYKGGKTNNVAKMVESQVKLQGPLYALAVKERLGLNTIAMMYIAVREDKRFGWGEVPGAELGLKPIPENWIEDARERSIERLTSFLSGAVQAEPTEPDTCKWCDFVDACRVEEKQALVQVGGVSNA